MCQTFNVTGILGGGIVTKQAFIWCGEAGTCSRGGVRGEELRHHTNHLRQGVRDSEADTCVALERGAHNGTTENVKFAECFYVCRVYSLGHSANKFFAECCAKNTRQKNTR